MQATNGIWRADADTDFDDVTGSSPPKKLMFTLNGRCNLRCVHCPRGVYDVTSHPTPHEVTERVVRELLPTVRAVRLGGTDLGEQLLARDFAYFMRAVIARPEIEVEITTNLTHLPDESAGLIAAGCNELAISLEGVGPAYERVRGFRWAQVESNLRKLVAARAADATSRLKICALVTCFYDNLDDLEAILGLAELGVDFFRYRLFIPNLPTQEPQALWHHAREANRVFRRLRAVAARRGLDVSVPDDLASTPGGAPPDPLWCTTMPAVQNHLQTLGVTGDHRRPPARSLLQRLRAALDDRLARWRPRPTPQPVSGLAVKPKIKTCHFPFEVVSILSDGSVGTCCEAIRFGTLSDGREPLERLWKGEAWVGLRQAVQAGRYEGACATCSFRRDSLETG